MSCKVQSEIQPLSCNSAGCYRLDGQITKDIAEEIVSATDLTKIIVNSGGGHSRSAAAISRFIYENNIDLVIEEECSSACFEYLVPAANSVIAIDAPLIGIHGNAFLYEDLYLDLNFERASHCEWVSLSWLRELYKKKGLNEYSFQNRKAALGEIEFEFFIDDRGCPRITRLNYEFDFWFPNSSQINDIFPGLISGAVCADYATVCEKKITSSSIAANQCKLGTSVIDC